MGDVYFKTERYDDALEQYKEALTKVEGAAKAPVLINVGKVLGRGDRQQEALENFLTAFSLVKDLDSKHMHIQQTVLNCIGKILLLITNITSLTHSKTLKLPFMHRCLDLTRQWNIMKKLVWLEIRKTLMQWHVV